jgi:hypothetical protein
MSKPNIDKIFELCFNELINGEYSTVLAEDVVDVKFDKEKALGETRNTIFYEWCEDNDKLYLVEGLFDHILKPNTLIDLKGYSKEEVIYLISPETSKIKGHYTKLKPMTKADKDAIEYFDKKLGEYQESKKVKRSDKSDLFE